MARIGEIITASQLKDLQEWSKKNIAQTVFVNPSVYKPAAIKTSGWNYYASAKDAMYQWAYLNNVKGYTAVKPAGAVLFKKPGIAETMGVTLDFFMYHPALGVVPAPYAIIKQLMYSSNKAATCIMRFYKTDGSGPYWGILDNRYLAITADRYDNIAADKVKAITDFHNTVQKLKRQYNVLASFVTELSKRKLNATEQQVFNESMLRLNNFQNQLRQLKGVTIVWDDSGKVSGIGLVPLVWVAIIVVSAIVATYSLDRILSYLSDAKKLDAANDNIQFVHEQKLKIAAAVKSGAITQEQADILNRDLDKTKDAAQKNADDITSRTDETVIDKITKAATWITAFYFGAQLLKRNNNG
jgi:hypothetical protein